MGSCGSNINETFIITSSGGSIKPITGLVGGIDLPVSGTSVYTNILMIGIGPDIQITIGEAIMSSYGPNQSFDFDPTTGTITLLFGNTFIQGQSIYINLNQ
jgi:hypothetical protein